MGRSARGCGLPSQRQGAAPLPPENATCVIAMRRGNPNAAQFRAGRSGAARTGVRRPKTLLSPPSGGLWRESAGMERAVGGAALLLATLAVNLQQPLYQRYAAEAHASNGELAAAFACYVGGLLPTLVLLGGASERFGRRVVLTAGLGCSGLATALMAVWPLLHVLFAARLAQGVGVGLVLEAGTSLLLGTSREPGGRFGPSYVAGLTSFGFGFGGVLTTIVDPGLHSLRPVSSWLLLGAIGVGAVAVRCTVRPTSSAAEGKRSLLRLPSYTAANALPSIAIGCAWSGAGFIVALLPLSLRHMEQASWSAPALLLMNVAGVITQPLARCFKSTLNLRVGVIAMPSGFALMTLGIARDGLLLTLIGVAGVGISAYGFCYVAGLQRIAETTKATGPLIAGFFAAAYVGFAVPTLVMGAASDAFGILSSLASWNAVLGAVALVLLSRTRGTSYD
jgi:MFS family permease